MENGSPVSSAQASGLGTFFFTISIVVFVCSLLLPVMEWSGGLHSGAQIAFPFNVGILALLAGPLVALAMLSTHSVFAASIAGTWLANVFGLCAFRCFRLGRTEGAVFCAGIASMFSLVFLLPDEAKKSIRVGYFVWVASFFLLLIGSAISHSASSRSAKGEVAKDPRQDDSGVS